MPFPTHVIVTLDKEGSFSAPPKEFREKMMAALKDYFCEKLEEEPWRDVEATPLWYVVQQTPLFKEKRMMVKLKNIRNDKESGEFEFKVFLTKRPEVYPKVMKRRCHQMCFLAWKLMSRLIQLTL